MKTMDRKSRVAGRYSSLSILIAACLAAGSSSTVLANDNRAYNFGHRTPVNLDFEYARVLDANPIIDVHQVSVPVEQCFDERVPQRHASYRGKQSRTPEILGAIVGAAVGNQFGGGSGKDIATVAGAVLGGSIGRDIKHGAGRNYNDGYGAYNRAGPYDVVQRCEVSQSYRSEERVVGYDVRYQYNGRVYQTRMPYYPGDRIQVRVSVEPVTR